MAEIVEAWDGHGPTGCSVRHLKQGRKVTKRLRIVKTEEETDGHGPTGSSTYDSRSHE